MSGWLREPARVDALRDTEVLDLLRHPVRDSQAPDERPDGMTIELLTYKLVYVAFLLDQGDVEVRRLISYLRLAYPTLDDEMSTLSRSSQTCARY